MKKFLALAALAGLAIPGSVRADRLDNRLLEEAPKLVEKLKAKKYGNVGVLRFQVDMPGKKPSYTSPLSGNLVTRMETGLIIHVDQEGKPVMGVIRDAGSSAVKQNVGSWSTSEKERRKLFEGTYPLAWGRDTVKADAFITGKVTVSKDYKKTSMEVLAFDKDNPTRLVTLASFTIPTDRNILRDLGLSFALPTTIRSRAIDKKKTDSEVDSDVIEMVQSTQPKPDPVKDGGKDGEKDGGKQPPKDGGKQPDPIKLVPSDTKATPADVGGVSIRMLADGAAVASREKATQGDGVRWEVECPEPSKKVTFELVNNGKTKVGVVLRINGFNIVNQQKDAPETCGKILLEPGKRGIVRGFIEVGPDTASRTIKRKDDDDDLVDPKPDPKPDPKGPKITLLPFKILVGEDAIKAKADLGDKAGLIEVDVFQEGAVEPELQISPRGLPPSKEKTARETYKGLRTALLQSSGLKVKVEDRGPGVKPRSVVVPAPAEERIEFKGSVKDFPNPLFVARVAIRIVPREEAP